MASKTSNIEPGLAIIEMAEKLRLRRAELGIIDADIPRNSGQRRTESKKALLKVIKEIGGKW